MAAEPSGGASTNWEAVTARSLAFLCLHASGLSEKPIVEQGRFLMAMGLTRSDAAAMLGSSDDSLRVMLARAQKPKRTSRKAASDAGE